MKHLLAEWCLASREDLSPRMAAWLDRHLAGCARCRAAADRGQAMAEALRPVRVEPPALDWDRIERRIRRDALKAEPRREIPRALVLAAAAALAAVVFFSIRSEGPGRPARTAPGPEERLEGAEREPTAGLVTLVQGSVFLGSPVGRAERRARPWMKVREGARIATATRAAIAVQTSPRTGFRLEERSRAEIDLLRQGRLELGLLHGAVGSSVAALASGDRFAIRIDSMVVHVKGTRFFVSRSEENVTVEVLEGVVEVVRYEETVSLRAPTRAVFASGAPLANAARSDPSAPRDALSAPSLNLRDAWTRTGASLRVPGDRGSGGEVLVDGVPLGTTPLLVLREPGPATVEILEAGRTTRFEVDVDGEDVEPGTPVQAHVAPARPAVGRLESAAIRRVIQSHTADVRWCYDRRLKRVPNLEARVEMRFTVGADGHVTDARAQRGATDPDIVSCLETKVRSWTFDRPEGGPVTVVYPLVFSTPAAEPRPER